MNIQWIASRSASSLHAAEALSRGVRLADGKLAAALAEPAARLQAEIEASGMPADRFWRHLAALSARVENDRQLVQLALRKSYAAGADDESLHARLAGRVRDVKNAARGVYPHWENDLALRGRPLQEQWEARGPGVLHRISRLTDERLLAPRAEAVLVHPALGGGGEAHLPYNSVRIEAVLANPHSQLPETLRLAWMLAQLQMDLPALGEEVHPDRLPHIAAWAMLPPVLAAGEHVELTRFDDAVLRLALDAWRIAAPPDIDAVGVLQDWWQTYATRRPPWSIALKALDQMVG